VAAQKKAATPFSAAAYASPPETAAGGRSSDSCRRPFPEGLPTYGEHPSLGRSRQEKFLAKIFWPFCGRLTLLYNKQQGLRISESLEKSS
jgi:hypothetical protein